MRLFCFRFAAGDRQIHRFFRGLISLFSRSAADLNILTINKIKSPLLSLDHRSSHSTAPAPPQSSSALLQLVRMQGRGGGRLHAGTTPGPIPSAAGDAGAIRHAGSSPVRSYGRSNSDREGHYLGRMVIVRCRQTPPPSSRYYISISLTRFGHRHCSRSTLVLAPDASKN